MVTLSETQRSDLERIMSRAVTYLRRSSMLSFFSDAMKGSIRISIRKIDRVTKRFVEDGIDVALNDKREAECIRGLSVETLRPTLLR